MHSLSQLLSDTLCGVNPRPVIVGVDLTPIKNKAGKIVRYHCGHFVLVTGKETKPDGTIKFLIADPYYNNNPASKSVSVRTSLDDYNNIYETRGSIISTSTTSQIGKLSPNIANRKEFQIEDASPLNISSDDKSQMNLSIDGVGDILIVDPMGRKTGFDPINGVMLDEIPNSSYWTDRLDNDESGEVGTGSANFVHISQPMSGAYNFTISGSSTGTYKLSQNVVSQEGVLQAETRVTGAINEGTTQRAISQVITALGGTSTLISVIYEADLTPRPEGKKTASVSIRVVATYIGLLNELCSR